MYDPVTLDQLRAFVTVVESGSFSAAARKLQRVQSAISASMANLEDHLGVPIWDRTTKVAKLTDQGKAVLGVARRVLSEADGLRRLTSAMALGLEPAVSLCLDALFPLPALVDLCAAFAVEFPAVDLRIDTQVLSAVSTRVLRGAATLGVISPRGLLPGLEREPLASIQMLAVVSPTHPLAAAALRGPIAARDLADATQIVLSERAEASDDGVPDQGVLSPRTWRVADLHTKHMMLRRGLGWGNLPDHVVRDDLRAKRLVVIHLASWDDDQSWLHLSAIYRGDTVFGPAHRWLLGELKARCGGDAAATKRPLPRARRARGAR
jgi:DNA-binding transcriptional LysR family regulator